MIHHDFMDHCALPLGSLHTTAIEPVVMTYVYNTYKAASLSNLPLALAELGRRLRMAEVAANLMLSGDPDYEGRKAHTREQIKLVDQLLSGSVTGPFAINSGSMFCAHLFERNEPFMLFLYESLMSAQIVLIWTAFETMVGDLWEATVNFHPQQLATLEGKAKNPEGKEKKSQQQHEKSLPFSYLARHRYDLSRIMGTVLRDGKVSFVTLEKMKHAFQLAFGDRSPVGGNPFWDNASLRTVNAIRNLIVHRAGVVDDEFLRKKRASPGLTNMKLGDRFFADGDFLRRTFRDFFNFGVSLILEVDKWLVANPASDPGDNDDYAI